MEASGQPHVPAALPLRNGFRYPPNRWFGRLLGEEKKTFVSDGIRTTHRPTVSLVNVLTELYQITLKYRANLPSFTRMQHKMKERQI